MQLPTEPKFSFFRSSVFLAGPVFNSGLGVVSIVHQCCAPNSYSSIYYIQVAFEINNGSLTSQYTSPHGHRYVNRSVCHNFLKVKLHAPIGKNHNMYRKFNEHHVWAVYNVPICFVVDYAIRFPAFSISINKH